MLYVLYSKDHGDILDVGVFRSECEFEEWHRRQLELNPDTKILKKVKSWGEIES